MERTVLHILNKKFTELSNQTKETSKKEVSPRIKEGHFITLKEVLYHEDITILIFYPSSNGFQNT